MTFLWPNMFWILLLIPVLIGVYILVQRRRQRYALRYASLSLVKEAVGRGPGIRRHIPTILFLLGLMIMITALTRPSATIILPSQKSTVILTIDVSGSMKADDIQPSRMEAAKSAARTFVEKQPQNVYIGIVSFSESASIVQSPTQDREQVLAAINRLTPYRGTAVGRGILKSLDAIFEEPGEGPESSLPGSSVLPDIVPDPVSPGSYAPAAIILLSDGESNQGPHPLDIINQASDRGVRVYTVGLGSPEGTVLHFDWFSVRVRLDEDTLKRIAARTDASYFKADSGTDLRGIYESLSAQLELVPEQTELTAGFTGLAALLLIIAGALSLLWFNRLP